MPLQVDEGGGQLLRRLIEDLGVTVHCGTSVAGIERDGGRLLVMLANGTELDVDLVVFSAGIRPRDQLARECGLDVGQRGGVVVDENCQALDEHVYAIGECAAVGGRAYGLVGPGYAMAEVVADRLLGGAAAFQTADTSTKLKLLGVDVASFGDALATTEGALEVTLSDPVAGTYSKLVVDDSATMLLGGVLVGDASRYPALRPLVGRPLPADPVAMIAPTGVRSGMARYAPISPSRTGTVIFRVCIDEPLREPMRAGAVSGRCRKKSSHARMRRCRALRRPRSSSR